MVLLKVFLVLEFNIHYFFNTINSYTVKDLINVSIKFLLPNKTVWNSFKLKRRYGVLMRVYRCGIHIEPHTFGQSSSTLSRKPVWYDTEWKCIIQAAELRKHFLISSDLCRLLTFAFSFDILPWNESVHYLLPFKNVTAFLVAHKLFWCWEYEFPKLLFKVKAMPTSLIMESNLTTVYMP